jgi:hypothetical protein
MFCDLVGSTALSARFDPEDPREVIAAYHRAVGEMVARSGGFVSWYVGDGVLVYFGYPQAHADDAERAVRAGLGAIDAVRRLDVKSVRLQTQAGIATGLGRGRRFDRGRLGAGTVGRRGDAEPRRRVQVPWWTRGIGQGAADNLRELVKSAVPLRVASRPEDIAEVVMFLTGPASRHMTGAIVPADAGVLLLVPVSATDAHR